MVMKSNMLCPLWRPLTTWPLPSVKAGAAAGYREEWLGYHDSVTHPSMQLPASHVCLTTPLVLLCQSSSLSLLLCV